MKATTGQHPCSLLNCVEGGVTDFPRTQSLEDAKFALRGWNSTCLSILPLFKFEADGKDAEIFILVADASEHFRAHVDGLQKNGNPLENIAGNIAMQNCKGVVLKGVRYMEFSISRGSM